MMEHFKSILFHKSVSANKQQTNQSINFYHAVLFLYIVFLFNL